jgi:hypothetical protein
MLPEPARGWRSGGGSGFWHPSGYFLADVNSDGVANRIRPQASVRLVKP